MIRFRYTLAAAALTVMIGGQVAVSAYATWQKLRGNHTSIHWQTWPWFDYPMYSKSAGPPVETNVPRLYAEFADGRRVEVTSEMTGLRYFAWRFNVLERLVAEPISTDELQAMEPERAAERRALAALVEEHRHAAADLAARKVMRASGHDDPPVRFVVEREVYHLEGRQMQRSETTQVQDYDASTLEVSDE